MSSSSPPRRGMVSALKDAGREFLDDDMGTYASALAFQVLLALFPFLIFLIALLGFLQLSAFFDYLREQSAVLLPDQASAQINQVIGEVEQREGGLLSFGIILAIWAASGGVRGLMHALNIAYDVEEGRAAWKRMLLSVVYTVALAALLIAALALMILGPQVMGWIAAQVGLEQLFVTIWSWARWPVIILLLMIVVAMIYTALPNVRQPFRLITPGSVLAVLVWVVASLGFSLYVQNFANYSATYGSLGAVVILLFYFSLSSAVLLFGAELNAVLLRRREAPRAKEQPAPPAPRQRGAAGEGSKLVQPPK
ncbi:MAG TPA: YihY/virulence factor BrkB family protein [Chloroflexaceae bacterium]|nr:YihY/virulence factor BrkB family protein [Chloroflexaceae bacterium]